MKVQLVKFLFLGIFTLSMNVIAMEHPFLIVKEDMYSQLQGRSSQSPWKEMKEDALELARQPLLPADANLWDTHMRASEIANSAALAYILDTNNRQYYADRIVDATIFMTDSFEWERKPDPDIPGSHRKWQRLMPPGSALFVCILALDVAYAHISGDQMNTLKTKIDPHAQKYDNHPWTFGGGVSIVWALFRGDTTAARSLINRYEKKMLAAPTDGNSYFKGGITTVQNKFDPHS